MSLYYQNEYVTLYHGDCLTEHREWLDADVLVTDPPYGVNWVPQKGRYRGAGSQRISAGVQGDSDPLVRDVALKIWNHGDAKPQIVFGSWRVERPARCDHRLIWHKKGQPPGPTNCAFMSQDEEIYVAGKGFRKSSPPLRSVIATSEIRPNAVRFMGHPTPKPIQLMEILIDRCPAGVVADPFAGSGATLEAARNLGRKAIGVELEEKYCEIIARRLDQGVLDLAGLT